jgi:hypothetical protein
MTQEERFAEQRKRNKVAYVIEDFYDSISELKYVWITHGVLAILFGASWLWGGDNHLNVVFSLATAAAIYAMQHYGDLVKQLHVTLLIISYSVGVGAEFLIAGFPDPLLPYLTVENGWIGTVPFLNSLTPFLYYGVRILLLYYLLQVIWLRYKLAAQPMSIVRLVDRQLAMRL